MVGLHSLASKMITKSPLTLTFLVLFATTLTSVHSSRCAVKGIQPALREVRSTVIGQIGVVRRAGHRFTALVHRLTDNLTALDPVASPMIAIRRGLDSFIKIATKAAKTLFVISERSLRRAARRTKHNCPDIDIDPLLAEIEKGLKQEIESRIKRQSNPRLFEIVGRATQKAVRGHEQALDLGDEDEANRITLVLRDVFALLIELFVVEIKDRHRQYFAFTEQLLLSAIVSAKAL